ncbi:hypothetical protein [Thalassotalea atypica]|uniref:hypothetical protein n=1 Tax=Thalassotalea atypica TaxID=2054316 RepID=UPI0025728CE5|nr:hypothetical protein [Thalassotalea atypica]
MKINEYINMIAALAGILSLVFVGYQIRQNTRVLQSQSNIDLLLASFSMREVITENSEVAALKIKVQNNYTGLSEIERTRYEAFVSRKFDIWEHAFKLNTAGLIAPSMWQAWNNSYTPLLKKTAAKEFWKKNQFGFSEDFQKHIVLEIRNQ